MSVSRQFSLTVGVLCMLIIPFAHAKTFVENNGIIMMEVESSPAAGDWRLQTKLKGYSGSGYYIWTGPDGFAKSTAGRGTIKYTFRVQKAGNFQLRWRSHIGKGTSRTEHNDSWVRFPTGKNVKGEQALDGWTKVFMNTRDNWAWQSATVDNVGKPVRQYFSAGVHTMEISGRSNSHAIDRIALYRHTLVKFSAASFAAMGNSGTSSTVAPSTPEPTPTPVLVPAPETVADPVVETPPEPTADPTIEPTPVVAEPIIEPDSGSAPESAIIAAPTLSVKDDMITWSAVTANVINVHRGSGEWLESLPASQSQWRAPSAGTYYFVATGNGSWETWGRSNTVTVEESLKGAGDTTVTAQIYSSSALELFWSDSGVAGLSFEVRRDENLLTISDGRSFFDSGLQAGTRYNYSVAAINDAGDEVWRRGVSASTLGGTINSNPANSIELSAKSYSQSALELFWSTDKLDASQVYTFDVYLGGALVETTDGRSYFKEGLTAETEYQFSVTAIDANGNPVLSDEISVETYPADKQ